MLRFVFIRDFNLVGGNAKADRKKLKHNFTDPSKQQQLCFINGEVIVKSA